MPLLTEKLNNSTITHLNLFFEFHLACEQTCTKIPFLATSGDASADTVILETGQIFFVVGSCERDSKCYWSVHCFCSKNKWYNRHLMKM